MPGRYGILLVDDEEEVRSAILKKIDWEGLGFGSVNDAENGEDALEKIEQLKPDVLMTDIRMPYMDGLELCTQVRKKYPAMKLLIFSGFDDFTYAKQAIKLNVTEYILKPVNLEELTGILKRVVEKLDEEIEQRQNLDVLRTMFRDNLPGLREVFFNTLVRGDMQKEQMDRQMSAYGIDLAGARKWDVILSVIERENTLEEAALRRLSVKSFLEESLRSYYRFYVFNSPDGIGMIVAIDEENSKTNLLDLLDEICRECRVMLGVTVTMGVGHSCLDLEEACASYQSAKEALRYRRSDQAGQTIYINDVRWERENSALTAVANAKAFIGDHFHDPDLSVDTICRILHVSPNYFSTIFKRETGQTYIAYVTQLRLEKAVELLEHTDDKTYVIAEKIGYPDQNYFSYVFKKKYGVSPTKYRRMLEEKA